MPASITFVIKDEDGKGTGSFVINIPETVSLPNMVGFALQLAPVVDAVIRGNISGISLSIDIDLAPGAVADTPSPGSDLEEGARFSFATAANVPTFMRIPTFNEALMVAGTDDVDVSLPSVAAFISAIEDGLDATPGGGDQVVEPVDSRGSAITNVLTAVESFAKYRN